MPLVSGGRGFGVRFARAELRLQVVWIGVGVFDTFPFIAGFP
jgi:hypothetical protein